MSDTKTILNAFYSGHPEDDRFTDKACAVEFFISRSYIEKYLQPGQRILEVGCGTGRYTLHYAALGYQVDALELLEVNLNVLKAKLKPEYKVSPVLGTALDLSRYADNTFDHVLVLGPMYHLFTQEDKNRCLSEALRVAKPGGKIYVAYTQFDAAMVQAAFGPKRMFDSLKESGALDADAMLPVSQPEAVFELYRREQIEAMTAKYPVKRLHYVGVDMFAHYQRETVNQMDDRMYQNYLRYCLSICENPHLTGAANHALDILEKLKTNPIQLPV